MKIKNKSLNLVISGIIGVSSVITLSGCALSYVQDSRDWLNQQYVESLEMKAHSSDFDWEEVWEDVEVPDFYERNTENIKLKFKNIHTGLSSNCLKCHDLFYIPSNKKHVSPIALMSSHSARAGYKLGANCSNKHCHVSWGYLDKISGDLGTKPFFNSRGEEK